MIDYNIMPDFEQRSKIEEKLTEQFPFIKKELVAKSLCQRPIYAYSIGENQNKTLYVGAFHGMEWLTSIVLLKFLEQCCKSIKDRQDMLCFRTYDFLKLGGLTIIPCINPDGVEIQINGSKTAGKYKCIIDNITSDTSRWQANARGIDLNHNFNAGWKQLKSLEIKNRILYPSPTRYGGRSPESEPESSGLMNFCKINNFSKALAFHSQGREIYWDFGKSTPKDSLMIANILADSAKYTVSSPEGLAVGGGFKDRFISLFKKPAFTVEIGLGKNPLPLSDFNKEYERLIPLLCLGIIL
ncbi:MAG: M14 family metallocarboxypeptidase [Ruminococcus sp.]|nr:M14 family metallocarboxypeptidase [Ruminococcus sp.]